MISRIHLFKTLSKPLGEDGAEMLISYIDEFYRNRVAPAEGFARLEERLDRLIGMVSPLREQVTARVASKEDLARVEDALRRLEAALQR